ncbi:MAG TPA: PBECR2 nuclease fold domain-containing protein [Rubrivivax sp.]|mgnify:CR=1 FL=1|nr:PBECR2 nuclease fold domain-containing protein [Rubrivivax sp.]
MLARAIDLSDAVPLRSLATPIEPAILRVDLLGHLVGKEADARVRCANFILQTLRDPFEVWAVDFPDGIRNRCIGLLEGARDFRAVLRVNLGGSSMRNIMQADSRKLNAHRIGWLRCGKQPTGVPSSLGRGPHRDPSSGCVAADTGIATSRREERYLKT